MKSSCIILCVWFTEEAHTGLKCYRVNDNISHELMREKCFLIVTNFSFFSFLICAPLDWNLHLVLTGKMIFIFILFDLHTLHHHIFNCSTPALPASFNWLNRNRTQLTYIWFSVHKLHEPNVSLDKLMWLTHTAKYSGEMRLIHVNQKWNLAIFKRKQLWCLYLCRESSACTKHEY